MAEKGNLYLANSAVIDLYDKTKAYETTVQEALYAQYKTALRFLYPIIFGAMQRTLSRTI